MTALAFSSQSASDCLASRESYIAETLIDGDLFIGKSTELVVVEEIECLGLKYLPAVRTVIGTVYVRLKTVRDVLSVVICRIKEGSIITCVIRTLAGTVGHVETSVGPVREYDIGFFLDPSAALLIEAVGTAEGSDIVEVCFVTSSSEKSCRTALRVSCYDDGLARVDLVRERTRLDIFKQSLKVSPGKVLLKVRYSPCGFIIRDLGGDDDLGVAVSCVDPFVKVILQPFRKVAQIAAVKRFRCPVEIDHGLILAVFDRFKIFTCVVLFIVRVILDRAVIGLLCGHYILREKH